MGNNLFGPMEIDAIGEIMNISLGSSATAVSNMLGQRVDITTPRVALIDAEDLTLDDLDPAIGVEIRYVSGLSGSNMMLLKRGDVKTIVDILMGTETTDEEFELNELTISAACEVMNQMMGAASTALSDFLGRMVNISTPESFELDNFEQFKEVHLEPNTGKIVVVRFSLSIEAALSSEFINVISVELARELISGFDLGGSEDTSDAPEHTLSDAEIERMMSAAPAEPAPVSAGGKLSQEEIERLMGGTSAPPPPEPSGGGKLSQEEIERLMGGGGAPPPPEPSGGKLSQEEIERLMSGASPQPPPSAPPPPVPPAPGAVPPPGYDMSPPYPGYYPPPGQGYPGFYPPPGYYYPPAQQPPDPKMIPTQPVSMPQMSRTEQLGEEQSQNLDLILTVPLEVSVEIGRTHRKVQEILTFSKGSLVVLDKLAGDQVDLFVNGQCIAKGDVVVVDDNFGIRITEILKPTSPSDLLQQ